MLGINKVSHLTIQDLQRLCSDREEESLVLEFKPCNELKIGTEFRDKGGVTRERQLEDVLAELTKDVTAFLNSAGGTIIYGILEKKSRANKIDDENAFKVGRDEIRPEKITHWLRSHINPVPSMNVYSVSTEPNTIEAPWYIVIEIPQGQTAYMAKDHRFYKRVANVTQAMEQYEVVDVMNRTRAAVLDLRLTIHQKQDSARPDHTRLELKMAITNSSFIASEYGALKLTLAKPGMFDRGFTAFSGALDNYVTGLPLDGYVEVPSAESMMIRWGANTGIVIFPGETFNFQNSSVSIYVPQLSVIPNPTYLIQAELFTINNPSRKSLFAICWLQAENEVALILVDEENYYAQVDGFWQTYHLGLQKFHK